MPLAVLLPLLLLLVEVELLRLAHGLEHVVDARHHPLEAAEVDVRALVEALEDLVPEAAFFALDELSAAVEMALVPLRQDAEPLRSFSVTTGSIHIMSAGGGSRTVLVAKRSSSQWSWLRTITA